MDSSCHVSWSFSEEEGQHMIGCWFKMMWHDPYTVNRLIRIKDLVPSIDIEGRYHLVGETYFVDDFRLCSSEFVMLHEPLYSLVTDKEEAAIYALAVG